MKYNKHKKPLAEHTIKKEVRKLLSKLSMETMFMNMEISQ